MIDLKHLREWEPHFANYRAVLIPRDTLNALLDVADAGEKVCSWIHNLPAEHPVEQLREALKPFREGGA